MTAKTALIDYALTHGWDDRDLAALEQALTQPKEEALEEVIALFGERYCAAEVYCDLVELLFSWYRE